MLPELQAERQLLAIEAATMAHPNLEPRSRFGVIERYLRRLRGGEIRAKSAHEALTQAGIPIVRVPAPTRPRRATGHAGTRRKGKRA